MRTRLSLILAGLLALAACAMEPAPQDNAPAVASQPVVATGTLADAPYRIDIPAAWNGDLVLLAHGYEPAGMPRQQPWPQDEATPIFVGRGYAVAASAYATQGWAVAEALQDMARLRAHFVATYGEPGHTYVVGYSMGGHLALAIAEQHGGHYAGALSTCGVNMPAATVFATAVTTLVAFDHFFPGVLPLAAGGLSDPASAPMVDPQAVERALASDEAAAALLAEGVGVPRDMLAGTVMLNYMVLREVQGRAGGHPVDNRGTVYSGFGDDQAFNRDVRRHAGTPDAVAYVARNAGLSGSIDIPVVLLSNIVDPTVPARTASIYPELVAAAGRDAHLAVLPPTGHGHCAFTPEQTGAAFDALVRWTETGARPGG